MTEALPLQGTLVIDASRMLPGAVLVRMLVDLGARVIKIEEPAKGDLMRHAPPLADGIGAGFQAFFRGVESVGLNLKTPEGQRALRRLCLKADVFVESFRSGTLESWGIGPDTLAALAPGLITCSLSGFGAASNDVAHDLNLVASAGLLSLLSPSMEGVPPVQLADVSTGMLAVRAKNLWPEIALFRKD
jgi:alpha-methylacyl-CoA racemase